LFAVIKESAFTPYNKSVEKKDYSLVDQRISEIFGARPTHSGVNMSGKLALYIPAFLQAVRLISETIGFLPCKVYHDTGESKEAAKPHSAYRIVHKRANGWTGLAVQKWSASVR